MHHAQNMVDQNIGVLQQTLAGLCNVVGTLEQKMHYLFQNNTAQSIKYSPTIPQRDTFVVWILTLAAELDGMWEIMEGRVFNKMVGYFKSLTGFSVWVQANIPSDAPKFDHFIYLDIILAGI